MIKNVPVRIANNDSLNVFLLSHELIPPLNSSRDNSQPGNVWPRVIQDTTPGDVFDPIPFRRVVNLRGFV